MTDLHLVSDLVSDRSRVAQKFDETIAQFGADPLVVANLLCLAACSPETAETIANELRESVSRDASPDDELPYALRAAWLLAGRSLLRGPSVPSRKAVDEAICVQFAVAITRRTGTIAATAFLMSTSRTRVRRLLAKAGETVASLRASKKAAGETS